MKKYQIQFKTTMMVFLLAILFNIRIIIENHGVAYYIGDSLEQAYYYLGAYWQFYHDGFTSFNFSIGLGANNFSLLFYNLFSPYNLLILPFEKESIKYLLPYLNIVKLTVLAFTTSLYLSNLTKSFKNNLIATTLFVFSGWILSFYQYHFLDAFTLFPLALFFADNYLKNGKILGFVLSVFAITVINFYLLYMFVPFILMYGLFRYLVIQEKVKFKALIIEALKYLGLTILAIALASFVLIPAIYLVLMSPRIASQNLALLIGRKDIFKVISSIFSYFYKIDQPFFLIDYSQLNYSGWAGGASLYFGQILPIALIYLLLTKFNKDKFYSFIFLGILLLMSLLTPFYKIFQGTIETRWFYMFDFLFLYLITLFLNEIDINKVNKKKIIIASLLTILFSFLVYFISNYLYLATSDLILKRNYTLIFSVWTILIAISIFLNRKLLLTIVIILATVYSNYLFSLNNFPIYYETIQPYSDSETINYIKENDHSFYRVLYEDPRVNLPLADLMPGNTFYLSMYNFEQEDFLTLLKSKWIMANDTGFYALRNKLANKYLILNDNDELSLDIPYGYEKSDNSKIYVNKYSSGLGFYSDKLLNTSVLKTIDDPILINYLYSHYLISDNFENVEYQDDRQFENYVTSYDSNYLEQYFDNPLSGDTIFLRNGGIPKITIKLYSNEELVKEYSYWSYYYIELYVSEDLQIDKVIILADDVDETHQGLSLDIYRNSKQEIINQYQSIKDNRFTNVVVSKDKIEADLILDKAGSVFTAIPYDIGWQVKVNGERIDYYKVNDGFIGFDLTSQDNRVVFEYRIPFFKLGLIISTISLAILVILQAHKNMVAK